MHPKLRFVRTHRIAHNGQQGILLEDPLRLSDRMVFVPDVLVPALALMDGTRDVRGLQVALQLRAGIYVPTRVLEDLIRHLDEALLLENDRFHEAKAAALRAYREAPHRPPSHAGAVYPPEPESLEDVFADYTARMPELPSAPDRPIRAVISPHIDYERGGPIYAGVWTYAAEAAREAELVILLGTDHNGDFGTVTLTRQHYATPYGVCPTEVSVVDALVEAIGEAEAFREELHHRSEHSIELALVWLHYVREGRPVPVVPVLLGSFARFVAGEADPARDPKLNALVNILRDVMRDRRTLVVAGADLAHVGPAFGDPPLDAVGKAQVRAADERVMQAIREGDATRFFREIAAVGNRYRICGLPPIYVLLRLLDGATDTVTGYAQCPADAQNTSIVTICGAALG